MAGQAGIAVRGTAWLLGGQVTVILGQVFYAALAGRLVTPAVFGTYAVAVSTAPLILMLATAGLGSAAARASELSESQVHALASVSLGLGVCAAGIMWLIAEPWSLLWQNPEAADPIRWSAIGILPAPFLGLLVGLSRRSGKFRQISVSATIGGFSGMAIGALCVWYFRSAASLVVSTYVPGAIQTILLLWGLGTMALPGPLRYGVIEHLRFGTKVLLSNYIGYLTVAAPQLALSRGVGAAMLGSWNRAAVITQVPLEMIQNSLVQVLYPEFRHDIGTTDRASRLWLDLLALAAWVMFPLGAVTAAGAYFVLPFILGPGWQTAASLAPWVAMAAVANVPGVVLGSALEATGRFGGVWTPRIAGLVLTISSALIALSTHSAAPVIAGLFAAAIASHALQLLYVYRSAIFPVPSLLGIYLRVFLVTAATALVSALSLSAILTVEGLASKLLLGAGVFLATGGALWRGRMRLPPILIAQRYGLFTAFGEMR